MTFSLGQQQHKGCVLPFEKARQSTTQWKRLQVLEINKEREWEQDWDMTQAGLEPLSP